MKDWCVVAFEHGRPTFVSATFDRLGAEVFRETILAGGAPADSVRIVPLAEARAIKDGMANGGRACR